MMIERLWLWTCGFCLGFVFAMEIYLPNSLAKAFYRGLTGG